MTVKELMERLSQLDENMEVKVPDNLGDWKDCDNIALITTEEYYIDKDFIVLE